MAAALNFATLGMSGLVRAASSLVPTKVPAKTNKVTTINKTTTKTNKTTSKNATATDTDTDTKTNNKNNNDQDHDDNLASPSSVHSIGSTVTFVYETCSV